MEERKRILSVDDDADFGLAISTLLESRGFEVRAARNGSEGLAIAKAWHPDLILLDVMMRERTEGFFVLQELRRTPTIQNIPVLIVSSIYAECPGFRVSPTEGWLPADQFLPKPVEPAVLLETIKRILSGRPDASPRDRAGAP